MNSNFSRVSKSAAADYIKAGGVEYGVDRIAEEAKAPVAEFAEEIMTLVGNVAAKHLRRSKFPYRQGTVYF